MKARTLAVRAVQALAWLGLLAGVLWVGHRLGHTSLSAPPVGDADALGRWAAERDAVTIGFAVLRLATLAVAWYLVAVTVVGTLARTSRLPRLVRFSDLVTLPAVRRLLAGAFGLGLSAAVGTLASTGGGGTAMAAAAGHDTEPAPDGRGAVDGGRADAGGTVVVMAPLTPGADEDPSGSASMWVMDPPLVEPAPATWTVAPGDSLWSLAEAHLIAALGRPVPDAELEPYWRQVVDLNRSHLVDPANADLLFAGQVLDVPPVPGRRR